MEKDFHLSICLRSAKGYRKDKEKLVKFLSRDTQEDQAVCSLCGVASLWHVQACSLNQQKEPPYTSFL